MSNIDRNKTLLVLLNMQDQLASLMDEDMLGAVIDNALLARKAFKTLGVDVVEVSQSPKVYGDNMEELSGMSFAARFETASFSAMDDEKFAKFLKEKDIKHVVIAGMEAHISVLMTAQDLIRAGLKVSILADSTISRNDFAWETALDSLQKIGADICVVETVVHQMLGSSEAKEYRDIRKILGY